eukprot:CAMPEP_0176472474 /NCGR_PEP_ID=MMETSP0127-20121128/41763_1 /TAXON_ID=938130 /ORGANISM="Platyophrya macrostoma, Strain WH" /LENGTH=37 /DNA_ID= /DNA_START= /DNA_END= /DNA_ORIENTATION=
MGIFDVSNAFLRLSWNVMTPSLPMECFFCFAKYTISG